MNDAIEKDAKKEAKTSKTREVFTLLRAPILLVVAYWILVFVFGQMTERVGLISPSGDISFLVIALGALVIVLRLLAFFLVPAMVLYRVGMRIWNGRA